MNRSTYTIYPQAPTIERRSSLSEGIFFRYRENTLKVLKSRPALVILCTLVVTECLCVLAELMVDLQTIRLRFENEERELKKFVDFLQKAYPGKFEGDPNVPLEILLQELKSGRIQWCPQSNSTCVCTCTANDDVLRDGAQLSKSGAKVSRRRRDIGIDELAVTTYSGTKYKAYLDERGVKSKSQERNLDLSDIDTTNKQLSADPVGDEIKKNANIGNYDITTVFDRAEYVIRDNKKSNSKSYFNDYKPDILPKAGEIISKGSEVTRKSSEDNEYGRIKIRDKTEQLGFKVAGDKVKVRVPSKLQHYWKRARSRTIQRNEKTTIALIVNNLSVKNPSYEQKVHGDFLGTNRKSDSRNEKRIVLRDLRKPRESFNGFLDDAASRDEIGMDNDEWDALSAICEEFHRQSAQREDHPGRVFKTSKTLKVKSKRMRNIRNGKRGRTIYSKFKERSHVRELIPSFAVSLLPQKAPRDIIMQQHFANPLTSNITLQSVGVQTYKPTDYVTSQSDLNNNVQNGELERAMFKIKTKENKSHINEKTHNEKNKNVQLWRQQPSIDILALDNRSNAKSNDFDEHANQAFLREFDSGVRLPRMRRSINSNKTEISVKNMDPKIFVIQIHNSEDSFYMLGYIFPEAINSSFQQEKNINSAYTRLRKASKGLHFGSIGILAVMVAEAIIKMMCRGKYFFKKKFEMFDAFIVIASFLLDFVFQDSRWYETGKDAATILVLLLPWRVVRIVNSFLMTMNHKHKIEKMTIQKSRKKAESKLLKLQSLVAEIERDVELLSALCRNRGISEDDVSACIYGRGRLGTTMTAISSFASLMLISTLGKDGLSHEGIYHNMIKDALNDPSDDEYKETKQSRWSKRKHQSQDRQTSRNRSRRGTRNSSSVTSNGHVSGRNAGHDLYFVCNGHLEDVTGRKLSQAANERQAPCDPRLVNSSTFSDYQNVMAAIDSATEITYL